MTDREEQPANLTVWWRDGALTCAWAKGRRDTRLPEIMIGRTDSRKALGFQVIWPRKGGNSRVIARFVLDREQVKTLRRYLDHSTPRLRPRQRARSGSA